MATPHFARHYAAPANNQIWAGVIWSVGRLSNVGNIRCLYNHDISILLNHTRKPGIMPNYKRVQFQNILIKIMI